MTSSTADTLGQTLRRLRLKRGMTQQQLATAAGTHITHVSRVESGERGSISRELLERLGSEVGGVAELAAAAGRVPASAEGALCRYPAVLDDGLLQKKTLPALRRLAAAVDAQRLLARVPGAVEGGRVDPSVICRHLKLRPTVRAEPGPSLIVFAPQQVIVAAPGGQDDPAVFPRVRFLLAHAAAHGLRQQTSCTFPRLGADEEDANDLAVQLLCPPYLVEAAFRAAVREAGPDAANPWAPEAGEVVASVGRKLGAPGWAVLRRLADEALLDDEAFYMLGDQL